MEKKSLLERTNSWKPFIDEALGAVNAKDYRARTIANVLHIVDPELSMWPGSLWRFLYGKILGVGFPSGREALYTVPFERFMARKGKVFENAPLAAIQGFNALVSALFPQSTATRFLVDERLARRRLTTIEKALKKQEEGRKAFVEWSVEMKAKIAPMTVEVQPLPEPVPSESEAVPGQPLPLFSSTSLLDASVQEKIERYLATSSLAVDVVNAQRTHERQVIALLEQGVEKAERYRQHAIITLSSPQFLPFRDLLDTALAIPSLAIDDAFLVQCFQEQDLNAVASLISARVAEYNDRFTPLITTADRRTKAIHALNKERERLRQLIEPFLQKKDLAAKAEVLLNQLSIIQIPETIVNESEAATIEKLIEKEQERLTTTSARIEEQFREFILQNRELSRTADFFTMMLFAARWEIVSATPPYPDLSDTITQVRKSMLEAVEADGRSLIIGKIGLSEFSESIVKAIYDVDIKVLRGELTARSLRMKDLRSAIISELSSMDRVFCLLSLAGNTADKVLVDREWVSHLLYKLLAPYELFKDTYDPESINILFRYWWLDFERFCRGKASRYYAFLHAIEEGATRLIRPIGRALDCLEKVKGGKRMTIYQEFIDATKNKRGAEAGATIEGWLRQHERDLSGAFLPQLALIPQVEQEPLIEHLLQIEERMREVTSFAKAIQAIKTFEPERLDSLLEVFSIFPFIETFDQPAVIRLRHQLDRMETTLYRVEEELIVELGLLDKKARMESGYAITNLLPQTLLKIPPILSALSKRLHLLAQHTDPYVSSIAHFLVEDVTNLSNSLEVIGFHQERLFSAFQKIAILLFHRKMLDNALQTNNFARILLLMTATGQIVRRFRILEAKGELSDVGTLIDELDAVSSGQWNIVASDLLDQTDLVQRITKFVTIAQRVIATSGLTERREAHLITGIERVCQELSDNSVYQVPRLSFVPGDLDYLWHPEA